MPLGILQFTTPLTPLACIGALNLEPTNLPGMELVTHCSVFLPANWAVSSIFLQAPSAEQMTTAGYQGLTEDLLTKWAD